MRKTYLLIALIWTLIITFLSLFNVGDFGSFIRLPHKDKIAHFVFYFLFYVLWIRCFDFYEVRYTTKIKVLVAAIGYGVLMEVLQALMGNHRSSDFLDAVANSVGAIVGFSFSNRFLLNKK